MTSIEKMFQYFGVLSGFKMKLAGRCPCHRCNNDKRSIYPEFTVAKAWHLEHIIKEKSVLNIVKSTSSQWRYMTDQSRVENKDRLSALAEILVLIRWTSIEKEIIKQVLEN
jgi:hypothetical protein